MNRATRRRLLITSLGIPHESRGASTVIFYHYIERLKRAGFQVLHWLLLNPTEDSPASLAEYQAKLAEPGRFEVMASQASRWVSTNGASWQINRAAVEEEHRRAVAYRADAAFLIDLLPAWYAQTVPAAVKVCWLGDLNFQTQYYHALYAAREKWTRLAKLPQTWLRCRSWRRIYQDVLRGLDSVIVSSISGEQQMRSLGVSATYHAYPWPAHPLPQPVSLRSRPTFLFLGNLQGLGSRSALHFLFDQLHPRLRSVWGVDGFEILVAGRTSPPAWAQREFARRSEFQFLGYVPDIHRLMAECHAVLAPIDVPVGNRTRILTAMYNRSLVIAHRNTALGNPDLVDGETCYLAATADQFVAAMQRAVGRPPEVARVIHNAHAVVQRSFDPDLAAQVVVDEIERRLVHRTAAARQERAA